MTNSFEPLDDYDLKILRTLADKRNVRNIDVADAVGLSPSACHQRTARLKKQGILRGFVADIDVSKIEPVVRVLTLVMLETQDKSEFQIINERLRKSPRVIRAHRTAGDFDYVFETLAPDFENYRVMLEALFDGVKIKQYQSRIMQEAIKSGIDASALVSVAE